MAVDVRELRAADVVMVKDRAHLAGDQAEAMPFQERLGLVAAVGKKARRPRRDRAFAHGRRLRENALRVELVSPAGNVADPQHTGEIARRCVARADLIPGKVLTRAITAQRLTFSPVYARIPPARP